MLRKTTIIPVDDADLAHRLFNELVNEQAHYLFVVLGAGEEAQTVVQRADNLAGLPNEPRWVAWARDPQVIAGDIANLKKSDLIGNDLASVRAFTLSISDEVRDVIKTNEEADMARIFQAFVRAEKRS